MPHLPAASSAGIGQPRYAGKPHQPLTCTCHPVAHLGTNPHTVHPQIAVSSIPTRQHRAQAQYWSVRASHPLTGEIAGCGFIQQTAAALEQASRLKSSLATAGLIAALLLSPGCVGAVEQQSDDSIQNIPQQLQSQGEERAPRLSQLVAGAKKAEIEGCTRRCVPTCLRGGEGAPGLGPITVRKEIVVFKEGFRSRSYCLSECATVCSLSIKGPQQAVTP